MKKTISVILLICLTISIFVGCDKEENKTTELSAVNVTTYMVVLNDINSEVNYTGEIKAMEESDVASKISASIVAFNYDVGDYVNAGDVLAYLDDTDYRLAYNQALVAYNNALNSYKQANNQMETALTSAEMEYNNAMDNYNRQKSLYDVGAISLVAFESAQTRLKTAELSLNSAKSNYSTTIKDVGASAQSAVDSAKVSLDMATNNMNNTKIVAPISGYVSARNGNIGQMAVAGSPMFSIKSTDLLNVEISVTESVIPYINEGTLANINVDTANISNAEGTVTSVNMVKNQQTGMYTTKIKINNPDGKLKIGMMADVVLRTQSIENAIVVPIDSLLQDDNGYYLYVVNNDIAEKRNVEIGISNNDFTEIKSGLKADDVIVVSGKEYISEKNNKIKIVEE